MKFNKKQLPFYAAIVQTIQYSFGGFLYFSWVGILVVGSMGALISFSTAYAASQINDIAKSRKVSSWVGMIALMLLSPVIIGTSLFYSLDMITNPVWRGIVAGVWGVLPDGATALAGFIAGKGMAREPQAKPKRPAKIAKQKEAKPKRIPCERGCGVMVSDTTNGRNAHNAHCKKNPAVQFAEVARMK